VFIAVIFEIIWITAVYCYIKQEEEMIKTNSKKKLLFEKNSDNELSNQSDNESVEHVEHQPSTSGINNDDKFVNELSNTAESDKKADHTSPVVKKGSSESIEQTKINNKEDKSNTDSKHDESPTVDQKSDKNINKS